MYTDLLPPTEDPMGQAIADYHKKGRADKLIVSSPDFDDDEIPVSQLFRTYAEMSSIEQTALRLARGKILDIGAGSGCHSLALQGMGKNVEAIDISALSVQVMKERGIKAEQRNFFSPTWATTYDTLLLLMNGAGIIGKVEEFSRFFERIKQLLSPEGYVLMDSSDLRYLYEEEDGSFLIDIAGDYYGELSYSMQYKKTKGKPFLWLYVDFETLSYYASQYGFKATCIEQGAHYDYLAKIEWR